MRLLFWWTLLTTIGKLAIIGFIWLALWWLLLRDETFLGISVGWAYPISLVFYWVGWVLWKVDEMHDLPKDDSSKWPIVRSEDP